MDFEQVVWGYNIVLTESEIDSLDWTSFVSEWWNSAAHARITDTWIQFDNTPPVVRIYTDEDITAELPTIVERFHKEYESFTNGEIDWFTPIVP